MTKLNEKLRILLANCEWTQKRLADQLYVSPDAVSSWVRGINQPSLETVKQLCEIFSIPIQDLTNDELDIPEYYEINQYIPYPMCCYPLENRDSEHVIIEASLADEGKLHRFKNAAGDECSAIYRGGKEIWWHYRAYEAKMIRDWNEVHSHDN